MTHPDGPRREAYVASRLRDAPGPVVAVSDWMRAVPDQIAPFVPGTWSSLGTDGFGLSDTRRALRQHFGVDASSIVLRVLEQLVQRRRPGQIRPPRGDQDLRTCRDTRQAEPRPQRRRAENTMTDTIHHPTTPEAGRARRDPGPRTRRAFEELRRAIFAEGALDRKTKQLIAVAVAHVTQCPYLHRRTHVTGNPGRGHARRRSWSRSGSLRRSTLEAPSLMRRERSTPSRRPRATGRNRDGWTP